MASKAFVDFCSRHYKNTQGLRLGQRFYILYLGDGDPWPEMFYGRDEDTCHLIRDWLDRHHYTDTLPEPWQPNGTEEEKCCTC